MRLPTHHARSARRHAFWLSAALLACSFPAAAQTTHKRHAAPAAQPAPAAPDPVPATPPPPKTPVQQPPQHAQISYSAGQLAVTADNSSLNQILREISQDTGIKITGGVAEERVFGKYGPADPSQVLAALLDGTSSNMLLLSRTADNPGELILTPRNGGPTPPNPNAHSFDDEPAEEPAQQEMPPTPGPPPPAAPAQRAIAPAAPTANPTTGTESGSDSSNNPNGVKTPQQIYEQLQRMRQQQQQQQQPQ